MDKRRKAGRPDGTDKSNELLFLDTDQLKSFFGAVRAAGDAKYELIFGLVYYLGLRVSELTDLRLGDIARGKKIADWTVTVNGKKHGRSRTYDSSELSPKLIQRLAGWIEGGRGETPNQYVFPGRFSDRDQTSTQAVKNMFKRYLKKAGLPDRFSVHCLRASCAVNLIKEGDASPMEIMRWLRLRTLGNAQIYFDRLEYKGTGVKVKRLFEGVC